MRVVFMGTPELSATILEALVGAHEVVGVFTRPDAVRSRGSKLVPSPVKQCGERHGLRVHTAQSLRDDEAISLIAGMKPDVICVAAFGAILPPEVLAIPLKGCLNVHTSLLPRWRGAAPIERAILAGDATTGACIMRMEEGLDTGPFCKRGEVEVGHKNVSELSSLLAQTGARLLLEAIEDIEDGTVEWVDQETEGCTYAKKIGKGELDFLLSDTAKTLDAKVRASSASHPARVVIANRVLAVERAQVSEEPITADGQEGLGAGEAVFTRKRLFLGTNAGVLELLQVRPSGKKSMEGRAFAAGVQNIKNSKVVWGRV